jgi:hypothetical protein
LTLESRVEEQKRWKASDTCRICCRCQADMRVDIVMSPCWTGSKLAISLFTREIEQREAMDTKCTLKCLPEKNLKHYCEK